MEGEAIEFSHISTPDGPVPASSEDTTINTDRPLPVGSLACDVLGIEYVANVAAKRRRLVEQHRQQPSVKASRLAHARQIRRYVG